MIIYLGAGGRSPADYGSISFEPETEIEGSLVDMLLIWFRQNGELKIRPFEGDLPTDPSDHDVDTGSASESETL